MLGTTLPGYSQTANLVVAQESKYLPVPIELFPMCSPSHEDGHHLFERSKYMLVIFGANGSRMRLYHLGVCRHQGEEIRHVERIETRCRAKPPNPPQCVVEF